LMRLIIKWRQLPHQNLMCLITKENLHTAAPEHQAENHHRGLSAPASLQLRRLFTNHVDSQQLHIGPPEDR
jgi:hypothetical protein